MKLKKAIEVLRAMSGGIKRELIELCEDGMTQSELSKVLDKPQSHLSNLLNDLVWMGLIIVDKENGKNVYRTNVEKIEIINQKIAEL